MRERLRLRAGTALVAVLALGLLPAAPRAAQATDARILRVRDGSAEREYTAGALVAAIGLSELAVADDPHFGPDRVFAGLALEPLLDHVGLGNAPELLLVCADGYRIPFERSVSSRPGLQGLLAIRDTALPADSETHWAPYRHGAESIDFGPFYLVWASAEVGADLGTQTLPWPFQLTEIHRFDRAAYFAPARPPEAAVASVRKGFGIYTAHCGKCHRMRGVGGDVGPALDREGNLSAVLPTAQLRDWVRHEGNLFPHSKMPDFSKLLSEAEIDQMVSYLQAMQPQQ